MGKILNYRWTRMDTDYELQYLGGTLIRAEVQ